MKVTALMSAILPKSDPIADASAAVDTLTVRRDRLAERQAGAAERLALADAARLDALTSGDPTPAELAKLDKGCADAANAHAGLVAAVDALSAQLAAATNARDALQDAAARALVAADAERRALALDAAAEALATAARAFGDARTAMVRAIVDHGARVDNVLAQGGSTPAAMLAKPITLAAIRLAAPGVLPGEDGFGVALDADPVLVMRRGQSGRLRDLGDEVARRQGVACRAPEAERARHHAARPAQPHRRQVRCGPCDA